MLSGGFNEGFLILVHFTRITSISSQIGSFDISIFVTMK